MPSPIVTLDTFEGASLETADTTRFIRPAFIEGIDVGAGDKADAMWLARQAVADAVAANPLSRTDVSITKILLRAVGDMQAAAQVVYESLQFGGGPPSTYVIRDGSMLTTYETYTMPDTYEEISVDWSDPGSDSPPRDPDPDNRVPADNISFTFFRPMRTIQVDALIYGDPTSGSVNGLAPNDEDGVGLVNDAEWPTLPGTRPRPMGYWLMNQWRTDASKYGGWFTLSSAAITNIRAPWVYFGTLRNQKTGRYVPIADDEKATARDFATTPYSRGIHAYNGFVRVDPYYTASFPAFFGW